MKDAKKENVEKRALLGHLLDVQKLLTEEVERITTQFKKLDEKLTKEMEALTTKEDEDYSMRYQTVRLQFRLCAHWPSTYLQDLLNQELIKPSNVSVQIPFHKDDKLVDLLFQPFHPDWYLDTSLECNGEDKDKRTHFEVKLKVIGNTFSLRARISSSESPQVHFKASCFLSFKQTKLPKTTFKLGYSDRGWSVLTYP